MSSRRDCVRDESVLLLESFTSGSDLGSSSRMCSSSRSLAWPGLVQRNCCFNSRSVFLRYALIYAAPQVRWLISSKILEPHTHALFGRSYIAPSNSPSLARRCGQAGLTQTYRLGRPLKKTCKRHGRRFCSSETHA